MGRFTIILIAIAIAVSGEELAAGLLLLGFEVGLALANPKPKSEPEPEPNCLGTYPFLNYQDQAERDCGSCPFAQDCYEETPFPYFRATRK